ncbi:hypothetical protein Ntsu_57630 [Nocardia sp. IFM 10818]
MFSKRRRPFGAGDGGLESAPNATPAASPAAPATTPDAAIAPSIFRRLGFAAFSSESAAVVIVSSLMASTVERGSVRQIHPAARIPAGGMTRLLPG